MILRLLLKTFFLLSRSDSDVLEESESEFESIDSVDSETACFLDDLLLLKLFDIDITDCITQDSSDDSSDFSCLSHDHGQKRDLKKKKVKKDTFFGKSNKSSK
jgi:hypothetical protein